MSPDGNLTRKEKATGGLALAAVVALFFFLAQADREPTWLERKQSETALLESMGVEDVRWKEGSEYGGKVETDAGTCTVGIWISHEEESITFRTKAEQGNWWVDVATVTPRTAVDDHPAFKEC